VRPHAQLTPEAEVDLAEAIAYYETQLSGLGDEFVAAVEQQLERIVENPALYQVLHRGVRRAVMRRFPYGIFYWVEEQAVVVFAVEHLARDAEHWKRRL
jgi:plasmid stabilization system protein ParE